MMKLLSWNPWCIAFWAILALRVDVSVNAMLVEDTSALACYQWA